LARRIRSKHYSQPQEHGLPELTIIGSLGKLDLGDQHRLDQVQRFMTAGVMFSLGIHPKVAFIALGSAYTVHVEQVESGFYV
jgi:hypothetical protein